MKRNCAEKVVVHMPEEWEKEVVFSKINAFYFETAERRLRASKLTALEKVRVIDQISECRKERRS